VRPLIVGWLARALAAALSVLGASSLASGQTQMPDPSIIHGRALPAPELPTGTVTVRVVRESIGNDAPGETVRITVGGKAFAAKTDAMGRAEFKDLPPGTPGQAAATVDGEPMESQPFTVPTSGGLRVILVAGIAKAAERRAQQAALEAAAPPVRGTVVFGGNSRVLMQFTDDTLQVYYVLDVVNNARARVDIGGPLIIDLPPGSGGATALEGSSKSATVTGNRITITGPFAPGTTSVQVAYRLLHSSGTVTFAQKWPAAFQQVTVGVEKVGALAMSSPQLPTTTDVTTDSGDVFVLGRGATLAADETLTVTLANVPHHSSTPRYVALGLAGALLLFGGWLAWSGPARDTSKRALTNRREALLQELEQLEVRRRNGSVAADRYATRRQQVLSELEYVYGELDQQPADGPRGGGEGVAA
jgi:hypothetical protein